MYETQAAKLRQIVEGKTGKAKVLAVTSGKGGVGKTNITCNLALCLAASNNKVAVMDADMGLGNLDTVMNITSRYNISNVLNGEKSLEEIIHTGPCGLEVICGGSGLEDLANLTQFHQQRLITELAELQQSRDIIIVDTAAGINRSVISFCHSADHTLVVTTPEPTAMTDAYAVIKVLSARNYQGRISLVVNMANSISEGKQVYRQISNVAARFLNTSIYQAGVLCKDPRLPMAVRKRTPVVLSYPNSQIASALIAMAARLSRGSMVKTHKEGFFQKVANWFF